MSRPALIYHLALAPVWEATPADAAWEPPSLSSEGFVHLSTAAQLLESARLHLPADAEVVALAVDAAALGAALRWEASRGGVDFPHLYGALPRAAVVAQARLTRDAAGQWEWPATLPRP